MEICFTDGHGNTHCFVIPQIVREWPDPDPDPWLRDLGVIDVLVNVLQYASDESLRKSLGEVVSTHLDQVRAGLPANVLVHGGGFES
ncbi:MAG: hypothetical protein ABI083_11310 [Lapillicoccus sp.]